MYESTNDVLDFGPDCGRSSIQPVMANPALAKFFGWMFGFGGFQHSCSARRLFTAESNVTSLGLSSFE